ncbi:GTP cyclohydrolase II [Rhizophagus clarus]|uniref:GTP cyclohydrolase II n=1 Tax=Rhizophagus clarus TaxID=94130 RepID=A0A8H3KZ98_9GLOM|nr:GTP cyclohydrolase II [Rhizophagus clarus]
MGFHNTEEAIFTQPLDVSTYNTSLKTETSTTITIPIANVTSTKCSTSSKKNFTNGLTNNHILRHSFRTSDAIKTLSTTPSTFFKNNNSVKVECQVRARIPTSSGEFFLHLYRNNRDNKEHLAIVYEEHIRLPPPLVRIHSECFTGETVHSARCDCGEQLDEAMRLMQLEGHGVVIYLRQEGRGIGLADKLRAYNLQDLGHDTVTANLFLKHPPDLRNYDVATKILEDLNLSTIRLLTNNPDKIEQIEEAGIKVIERVPMVPIAWQSNHNSNRIGKEVDQYLKVKVERMGHLLNIPETLLHIDNI